MTHTPELSNHICGVSIFLLFLFLGIHISLANIKIFLNVQDIGSILKQKRSFLLTRLEPSKLRM
jgi:hypothetical protein